jgi:7-cyano-7-deazaguanine reductase
MRQYTAEHARSGIDSTLPGVECWENQYPGYQVEIVIPEYTAICPRTGLPDFGTIHVCYSPDKWCLELKSLKEYINAFRNLGIFYENAVNRILRDLVAACRPLSMTVRGEFSPRGGILTKVEASYTRPRSRRSRRE